MAEGDAEAISRLKAGECLRIPRLGKPDHILVGWDGELVLRVHAGAPISRGDYARDTLEWVMERRPDAGEFVEPAEVDLPITADTAGGEGQQRLIADGGRTDAIDQMRGTGCDPGHHEGPISARITMGEEVQVDKFCENCGTDVEGWNYKPGVESVDINLVNGQTETFSWQDGETDG